MIYMKLYRAIIKDTRYNEFQQTSTLFQSPEAAGEWFQDRKVSHEQRENYREQSYVPRDQRGFVRKAFTEVLVGCEQVHIDVPL